MIVVIDLYSMFFFTDIFNNFVFKSNDKFKYKIYWHDGLTWKTVRRLCQKESKLLLGFKAVGLKLNFPPNTCIPRRAKITINKKRSNKSEAIDCIELSSDATKFERDLQYL